MIVATIARDSVNSPNMEGCDAMILDRVIRELEAMGAEVIQAASTSDIPEKCDAICHMSRNSVTLDQLEAMEKSGIRIINTPEAVKNCSRLKFIDILEKNNIPQPEYRIFEKAEELQALPFPAWIKRGEGWSCHKDDVCHARNMDEAVTAAACMRKRGITGLIYTRHCEGDIIKFYGVGRDFFHHSYPNPEKSKFGLEKINGTSRQYPFDIERLKETAFTAAEAIGLQIYGGDCIVTPNGGIYIIDINDFPSFSAIREEAAKEIAKEIIRTTQQ